MSALLGYVFKQLSVPAGWVLAAILVSATTAIGTRRSLPLSPILTKYAKGVIAVLAAAPLVLTPVRQLLTYLLPGLAVTTVTLGVGLFGGFLLSRAHPDISVATGMLSMLAGGASVMPFLAREAGADYRYVTLSQYLRLLTVMLSLPFVVSLIGTGQHGQQIHTGKVASFNSAVGVLGLVLLVAIIMVGDYFGKLIRLPAPSLLGPMALTIVIYLLAGNSIPLQLPAGVAITAFMCIGWMAGGMLDINALKAFARTLPATILFIAGLMLACGLTALLLVAWLGIPYLDAYLATSPGGLETVLIIATEGGAGAVVPAAQIIRLVTVLVIAGWLPRLLKVLRRLDLGR